MKIRTTFANFAVLLTFTCGGVTRAAEPVAQIGTTAPSTPATSIAISAGKKVLELNSEKTVYEHLVSESVCRGGVDSRILWMSSEKAVMTRKNCNDVDPQTLSVGTFWTLANDPSVLIASDVLYQRVDGKTDLIIESLCSGGEDSKLRPIAIEVKKQLSSGNYQLKLMYPEIADSQSLVFWTRMSTEKKFINYQTGPPTKRPFIRFSMGDLHGLTGIVSYDFDSAPPGKSATLYKEGMITLPHCFVR